MFVSPAIVVVPTSFVLCPDRNTPRNLEITFREFYVISQNTIDSRRLFADELDSVVFLVGETLDELLRKDI